MKEYLYFKMPKTASTYLHTYIKNKGYDQDKIAICKHKVLYQNGHKIVPGLEEDYKFKFCFVRNPLNRFISSYKWITHNKRKFNPIDKKAKESILKYKNLREFCLNLEEFVSDPDNCPIHFYPQHEWIEDEQGNLVMDFVGKFETLNEDWEKVCQKVHLEYEPIFNKKNEEFFIKKQIKSVQKNLKKMIDNQFIFTDEICEIVQDFYQKDYNKFKY